MTWVDLTPSGIKSGAARKLIRTFVSELSKVLSSDHGTLEEKIEIKRRQAIRHRNNWKAHTQLAVNAAINVFSDLAKHGWQLCVDDSGVRGIPPKIGDLAQERERRRGQLAARRNEQLREQAVREFISQMEIGHFHRGQRVSIFSLMRDGRDLADAIVKCGSEEGLSDDLIRPYVQVISQGDVCEQTGFLLNDIWRYFRHTWASPYESIPGRTMMILVRDAAAPYHPIIGIAALSSAAVKLAARDDAIGWDGERFREECETEPTNQIANWVLEAIDAALADIYKVDLIKDKVMPPLSRKRTSDEVIAALQREAKSERKNHHRKTTGADYKKESIDPSADDEDWEKQARTHLFRSKRALDLASLLELRNRVLDAYKDKTGVARLRSLLATTSGKEAFKKIVRIARSRTVGTEIADLTVCGAVAPYNEILGGKLVAMLAVSPTVIAAYKRRYGSMASIIASSMAGRRVVRPGNLVFVGTTSLYGVRPSQYDRLALPAELVGGPAGMSVRYRFLKETVGWGTFQFGSATKKALEQYVTSLGNGWRVNNVFGEGANPKLRALRDGLTSLGLKPELLLKHGQHKCIYGVSLASNLREYLLGVAKKPKYIFDLKARTEGERAITTWWFQRWAVGRIRKDDTVEGVKQHAHIHPIRHGARVVLPSADLEQHGLL